MKTSIRLITAFALALLATGAHAYPGADEAIEFCFDNANRGASISFYLYPAKDGKRDGAKVWESGRQNYHDSRRCVSVHQLLRDNHHLKPGQPLIAYYTIEGKLIGAAHLACTRDVFMKKKWPVQRMIYTTHGSTIFNVSCKRTIENKGRFAHPDGNGAIAVSTICFVNKISGNSARFRLYPGGSQRALYNKLGTKECVQINKFHGYSPGTKMRAKIKLGDRQIDCSPSARIGKDPGEGVQSIAEFAIIGWSERRARCRRTNYLERK